MKDISTPAILQRLRARRHVTQAAAARAVGISPRSCSDYETGRRKVSLEILIRFARYYDVSLDYLTGSSRMQNPFPRY